MEIATVRPLHITVAIPALSSKSIFFFYNIFGLSPADWFHAEAVEVEESKLSDVIGFKCCRCRRIKPPNCPYRDVYEDEKLEAQRSRKRASKQGTGAHSGTIGEPTMCELASPVLPLEDVFIQDDDPLLFSLSRVEQITEQNSGVDFEWNITGQGPQKLPVRRQGKGQGDAEGAYGNDLYHDESSSMFLETSCGTNSKDEMSCAEWDVSGNGLEGEMGFDYDNYEDMEFEPQTYFSFTELLAPDEGDAFDASWNVLGNSENQSHAHLQDEVPEQHAVGTTCDQLEPMMSVKSAADTMPCKMCLNLVPAPDLSCNICGLVIHRYCSPWVEASPSQGGWKCGNCREWR